MEGVAVLVFIVLCSLIFSSSSHNRKSQICPTEEEDDDDRAFLRNFLFGGDRYKYERLYPDRETNLWQDFIERSKLSRIRRYILRELSELPRTDWEEHVLNAICRKSSSLNYYLTEGHLDLDLLKREEENGIKDALNAVKHTNMEDAGTLRDYFHLMYENILYSCRSGNHFYLRGPWKVARALKSYVASRGEFFPSLHDIFGSSDTKESSDRDDEESEVDIFGRLAGYYYALEESRKRYLCKINTNNPVIEFDLEKINNARSFAYEGSLTNCLYLNLQDLLQKLTGDEFPEHRFAVDENCDGHSLSYAYSFGTIRLTKYTGAVEYFPHRLYIEFDTIAPTDPIMQKLRTYKLHLEGNG